MSETGSPDAGFRGSLLRHAAGGLGVVVAVAALFWVIGSVGGEDDEVPTTAGAPAGDVPDATRDEDEPPADVEVEHSDGDDDVDELASEPSIEADEPTDEAADEGTRDGDQGDGQGDETDDDVSDDDLSDDDVSGDVSAEDDAPADDGSEEAESDAGDEQDEAAESPSIDPSTITVQVLDGYQADGGAAADAVTQQLTADGYDVVARNPALRYEDTTVLWTAGFEDEGRQVARAIGAAEAREQSGNLSESVAVHVVVGADRG